MREQMTVKEVEGPILIDVGDNFFRDLEARAIKSSMPDGCKLFVTEVRDPNDPMKKKAEVRCGGQCSGGDKCMLVVAQAPFGITLTSCKCPDSPDVGCDLVLVEGGDVFSIVCTRATSCPDGFVCAPSFAINPETGRTVFFCSCIPKGA